MAPRRAANSGRLRECAERSAKFRWCSHTGWNGGGGVPGCRGFDLFVRNYNEELPDGTGNLPANVYEDLYVDAYGYRMGHGHAYEYEYEYELPAFHRVPPLRLS